MCGIVGYRHKAAATHSVSVPQAMCDAIVHRGPDDQGLFLLDNVFLGMRRLAIIDPAHGQQPVLSDDGQVALVFNGEIYNYRELQEQLRSHGVRLKTDSDSEVVLHCYMLFGEQCFAMFNGMFAIAIWDGRTSRILLARDRLGKKPLFYQHDSGGLIFGSELKALRQHPSFDSSLCDEALREYMMMGYVHYDRCIFRHSRKVPPAHYLIFDGSNISLTPYWSLDFTNKSQASESELKDQLESILLDSLRLRLRSDVDFGAFLSGGLDSSIVVAMMAKLMDRPVKTFSIGFEEAAYNELDAARLMADSVGAQHHEQIVRASATDLLDHVVWHLDEPMADSSALPTFQVANMASKHVKMVLSGDGGDEVFGGYERYFRYQTLSRLPRGVASLAQMTSSVMPGALGRRLAWLGTRLQQPYPNSYLSGVALATPDFASKMLKKNESSSSYGNVARQFENTTAQGMDSVFLGDINSYLLDDILVKVDRMTMANSLECRSPLLDHRLLEFSAALPLHYKMRKGQGKYLLRELAGDYIPQPLLDKPKQGFALPVAQWFRGELSQMTQDLLASQRFRERGIFNVDLAKKCMSEHLKGKADHSEHLWQLLCFERWAKVFLDSNSQV